MLLKGGRQLPLVWYLPITRIFIVREKAIKNSDISIQTNYLDDFPLGGLNMTMLLAGPMKPASGKSSSVPRVG